MNVIYCDSEYASRVNNLREPKPLGSLLTVSVEVAGSASTRKELPALKTIPELRA